MTLPSRRALLIALASLLLVALLIGIPWLSPARGVERAWKNVVSAIEENDQDSLASYLGQDYKDGFGLDRGETLRIAAGIRRQFLVCTIRLERPTIVMDVNKHAAITRALIRLDGQGTSLATAAIQASQASQTPTEFRWRRNSWKPWDWRLISVENNDAARGIASLARYRDSSGLTP